MSTIKSSTTTTTAYQVIADTTGTLVLQTGSSPTTALTIDTSQNILVNGASAVTGAKLSVAGGIQGTITSGTSVASTSGTSIDFTGIPSWVKRITVMFNGVSTNGTSNIQIQIGSGSFTTTGYVSGATQGGGATATATSTTGFIVNGSNSAVSAHSGNIILDTLGSNIWVSGATLWNSAGVINTSAGNITLGGALDRVRITTVNGTDAFDAGSINILYEG